MVAVVGDVSFATITALLALLEDRVPFVLLHPRWTRMETNRAVTLAGARLFVGADGRATPVTNVRTGETAVGAGLDVDTACIVFTSGTSGRPRGAVLRRGALVRSAAAHAEVFGWQAGDRWLLGLPTAHVGGLMIVIRCLVARRTVVLGGRRFDGSFDAEATRTAVERHRVTLLSVVPTMLGRLVGSAVRPCPSSLRAVLVGGAAASPALITRARRAGWPVFATYGLTEACSQVATQRPGAESPAPHGVGPPMPGLDLRIRAADGVVGPIEVRGASLFDGYLAEPGAALERPFGADGWFDTGDLGMVDEQGSLRVLGRAAHRIVTGGENVDPAEVEAAVAEWPGAAAVCVVGCEDREWGERVAAVVARGESFDASGGLPGLERHLAARLAGFKRPRRWRVVEELPMAHSGKVDCDACRELLAGPPPALAIERQGPVR